MTEGPPDLGYPTAPHGRIPTFHNIEEEAEFWDTHSFTDYLDQSEPATLNVSPDFRSVYSVYLNREDYEELTRQAKEIGVGPSTLARVWIKDRLRQGRVRPAESPT